MSWTEKAHVLTCGIAKNALTIAKVIFTCAFSVQQMEAGIETQSKIQIPGFRFVQIGIRRIKVIF